MNIKRAKQEIKDSIEAYLTKAANNKNKNAQGWEEKEDNDTEMPIGNIDEVEKLM